MLSFLLLTLAAVVNAEDATTCKAKGMALYSATLCCTHDATNVDICNVPSCSVADETMVDMEKDPGACCTYYMDGLEYKCIRGLSVAATVGIVIGVLIFFAVVGVVVRFRGSIFVRGRTTTVVVRRRKRVIKPIYKTKVTVHRQKVLVGHKAEYVRRLAEEDEE
jgi:hypothetical protein